MGRRYFTNCLIKGPFLLVAIVALTVGLEYSFEKLDPNAMADTLGYGSGLVIALGSVGICINLLVRRRQTAEQSEKE